MNEDIRAKGVSNFKKELGREGSRDHRQIQQCPAERGVCPPLFSSTLPSLQRLFYSVIQHLCFLCLGSPSRRGTAPPSRVSAEFVHTLGPLASGWKAGIPVPTSPSATRHLRWQVMARPRPPRPPPPPTTTPPSSPTWPLFQGQTHWLTLGLKPLNTACRTKSKLFGKAWVAIHSLGPPDASPDASPRTPPPILVLQSSV